MYLRTWPFGPQLLEYERGQSLGEAIAKSPLFPSGLPGAMSFDRTDTCPGRRHAHGGLSAWLPRMAGIFKGFSDFRGRSGAMSSRFRVVISG